MGSVWQEDITFVNTYTPNRGATRYIKRMLMNLQGEIKSNTMTVEDFKLYLHQRINHQDKNISKEISVLNNTLDQVT